ncbi:ubiquitin carboxyl-terminal hydrolase 34-like isoform X2 [Corticium candelabrum]|uniref:ubiquitin carboxyl-terminal hydrolase 34-like isoform X2 n=1 Tax=Corticium candelabrum TaxID=121492 RepID=UPI002E25B835|nr:ubiquitin carboxyl-terminal hydrolase 34-like isoform X2 [Corticium candelabrum]
MNRELEDCSRDISTLIQKARNDTREEADGDQISLTREECGIFAVFAQTWRKRGYTFVDDDEHSFSLLQRLIQAFARDSLHYLLSDHDDRTVDVDFWCSVLLGLLCVYQRVFPQYQSSRNVEQPPLQRLSAVERDALSQYVNLSTDSDPPVYLLHNIHSFCRDDAFGVILKLLEQATPETLKFSVVQLLFHVVFHVRMWLHTPAVMDLISPLKLPVYRYMYSLSEEEIKTPMARNRAEIMWTTVRGNYPNNCPHFDKETFSLALKYLTSSTLTVRIFGLAQINAEVTQINKACANGNASHTDVIESTCEELTRWMLESQLIEKLFGPSLHVELVKLSQTVLIYLAMEGKLTLQHLNCIWSAARLKHSSHVVYSLLPELVRHLDVQPLYHLTQLVNSLPLDEHSTETLQLSFVLTKRAWKFRAYLESGHCESRRNRGVNDKRKRTSRRAKRLVKRTARTSTRSTSLTGRRGSSDSSYSLDSCSSLDDILLDSSGLQLQFSPQLRVVSCQTVSVPSSLTTNSHSMMHVTSPVVQCEVSSTTGAADEEMVSVERAINVMKCDGNEENLLHGDDAAGQVGVITTTNDVAQHVNGSPAGVGNGEMSALDETVSSSQESVFDIKQQQRDGELSGNDGWLVGKVCGPGKTLLWDLMHDDKACRLQEGIAAEVNKYLCQLVCTCGREDICKSFIEGCLTNLDESRSVVSSLRLLSEIFSSCRLASDRDSIYLTRWAETELSMIRRFFTDLLRYMNEYNSEAPVTLYSHQEEVRARLKFLTSLFRWDVSTDDFQLGVWHVDVLWSCLVARSSMADEALNWFLHQLQSSDHHTLSSEAVSHLFFKKMPELSADYMTVTGLKLWQQLVLTVAQKKEQKVKDEAEKCELSQIWSIALHACDSDVIMMAMNYINNHYINAGLGSLEKESEFIDKCMSSLTTALSVLDQHPVQCLHMLHSGLTLLRTHIEAFSKRYCYHLRKWKLKECGVERHVPLCVAEQSMLKLYCHQPGRMEKEVYFEMSPTSYVAELRAEIETWMEKVVQAKKEHQTAFVQPVASGFSSFNEEPISWRIVISGQELTRDVDSKTLEEVGLKDQNRLFVSPHVRRHSGNHNDPFLPLSLLSEPPREHLPMTLLSHQPHFTTLFQLMEQLDAARKRLVCRGEERDSQDGDIQQLTRMTWDLVVMLPTSSDMLESLSSLVCEGSQTVVWEQLLDSSCPFRLLYSLQIIEKLVHADSADKSSHLWKQKFITVGGLERLVNILKSGHLETTDNESWSEWHQKCMSSLLLLISSVGDSATNRQKNNLQEQAQATNGESASSSISGSNSTTATETDSSSGGEDQPLPPKKQKHDEQQKDSSCVVDKPLRDELLSLLNDNTNLLVYKLMRIAEQAAVCACASDEGRICADVVSHSLELLCEWYHCRSELHDVILQYGNLVEWFRSLTLTSRHVAVHDRAYTQLLSMCMYEMEEEAAGSFGLVEPTSLLPLLLKVLLRLLPEAVMYTTASSVVDNQSLVKGCRSYFNLVSTLVESCDPEQCDIDFDQLAIDLTHRIISRPICELPHIDEMDEGLVGLLSLCSAVMRHEPAMKNTKEGRQFIKAVANDCLFDVAEKRLQPGCPPKCKTLVSRQTAFNLLCQLCSGLLTNFEELAGLLASHHLVDHPWYYSPADDTRSELGFVGLINLGATCYMASCLQQLYMMSEVRAAVLNARGPSHGDVCQFNHQEELRELQKMFSYLVASERKAYNPQSLCRMYKMDHETLNPCEQKDMTEFFTDLVGKMEEMSMDLRHTVHSLFRGVMTNNVVSLDCSHVSRTKEEFYLVRCTVENMKDLYESLAEVTVKDTLEGDNMYTCSRCGHKVRAEKRACFKVLPRILCINTMRYTFNMVTMMKEKINTRFVFPMRLDMSNYTEETLMGRSNLRSQSEEQHGESEGRDGSQSQCCEYELVGVVVHTGTADGGHYYSFIRDRTQPDKWYWFNDAEVRSFDPSQIPAECFGGEMTTKTYDSRAERFVDFSFEKSHSAYMLFYERCATLQLPPRPEPNIDLPRNLAEEIWRDNRQLLRDQSVFDDVYGQFMWKIARTVPRSIRTAGASCLATKIGLCYVLGTLVHSKDQRMLSSWSDWLLQQLDACPDAAEWLLEWAGSNSGDLLTQMLLQCSAQPLKQMFMQLVLKAIQVMRMSEKDHYLKPFCTESTVIIDPGSKVEELGSTTCVGKFMKIVLNLVEHSLRPTDPSCLEVFQLLHQIARFGHEEQCFLLSAGAVSIMINFYLYPKTSETSEDTEDDEVIAIALLVGERTARPLCLEYMVTLISLLVDTSRKDKTLAMLKKDLVLLLGSKDYPFIYQQTKDSLNLRGTAELILALCKYNKERAASIVEMITTAVCKLQPEPSQPFLKLLGHLVEVSSTPCAPPFTTLILDRMWSCVESSPLLCLDWLTQQVPRSVEVSLWMHQQAYNLDLVEEWLLSHSNARVRLHFANLLASLVPSPFFRQMFRSKALPLSITQLQPGNQETVQKLFKLLLYLIERAKKYVKHDTDGLVAYFNLMTTCLVSKSEKLMVREHFLDLWRIFQDLAAIEVPINQSKQAVVQFWYYLSKDCSENLDLIVKNEVVSNSIGFCYILADADMAEVVNFNNRFLYFYYGLLHMCCVRSETFAQRLALHTNTDFAFKHFLSSPNVYPDISDELFLLLEIFAMRRGGSSSVETAESATQFRKHIIPLFLHNVDGQNWAIWLKLFGVILHTSDDVMIFIAHDGLTTVTEAFGMLQQMYHEATACNVVAELLDLLNMVARLLKVVRRIEQTNTQETRSALEKWAKRMQLAHWLLNFLNPSTPDKIREACLDILLHLVRLFPSDCIDTLLPVLEHTHRTVKQSGQKVVSGTFFPRKLRSRSVIPSLGTRRMCELHMHLHPNLLEVDKGVDRDYDAALVKYFGSYHQFAFELIRIALNRSMEVQETAVNLSALLALEGASIHLKYAAEFWNQVITSKEKKLLPSFELFRQLPCTREYCEAVLFTYRKSLVDTSICSVISHIFQKVHMKVLPVGQFQEFAETLIAAIVAERCGMEGQKALIQMNAAQQLMGDLHALHVTLSAGSYDLKELQPGEIDSLVDSLSFLSNVSCRVQLKLKEQRQHGGEDANGAAASQGKSVSAVNSNRKDETSDSILKTSREDSGSHRDDDSSMELFSPTKKVRLELKRDLDEGNERRESVGNENKLTCEAAKCEWDEEHPAAVVDLSWLEKLEGLDERKCLLTWTTNLLLIADAIVKLVKC